MKAIAFYLPQFHRIPENDLWWGKGFTDWFNVQKARPSFPGHFQPRTPLNANYYDLLDPSVKEWQARIAHEYGLSGFCYYHYWFSGRLLLQRPIEQMLQAGRPDFPFCIAWANEPWISSWNGRESGVLIPQNYGGKDEWEEHFSYLLPFLRDKRYIKVGDKPLLIIYRSASIPNYKEMIGYWRQRTEESGLKGIFLAEMQTVYGDVHTGVCDAKILFEPMYTFRHDALRLRRAWRVAQFRNPFLLSDSLGRRLPKLPLKQAASQLFSYDSVWKTILERPISTSLQQVFPGAFVDWDNSPRYRRRATVIVGASPEKFRENLCLLLRKARREFRSDFVFINAWNEWGEGAYLEPDQRHRFAYLQAMQAAMADAGVDD